MKRTPDQPQRFSEFLGIRYLFTMPGAAGDGTIYVPVQDFPYFLLAFTVRASSLGTNALPRLVVEHNNQTLSLVAGTEMIVELSNGVILFDLTQKFTLSGGGTTIRLQHNAMHIALPIGGLYVPLGARCRFDCADADAADVFESATAQFVEAYE